MRRGRHAGGESRSDEHGCRGCGSASGGEGEALEIDGTTARSSTWPGLCRYGSCVLLYGTASGEVVWSGPGNEMHMQAYIGFIEKGVMTL